MKKKKHRVTFSEAIQQSGGFHASFLMHSSEKKATYSFPQKLERLPVHKSKFPLTY